MKKETENLLYNKQFYEFNSNDCKYLKKLIYKYYNTYDANELLFLGPIMFLLAPLMVYGFNFVVTHPLLFAFFGFVGLTTGAGVFTVVKKDIASLKELGLTRKEWRALKKTNKIEELEAMLDKYLTTEKALIKEMNEKTKNNEHIITRINNKTEEKEFTKKNKQQVEEFQTENSNEANINI